VVYVGLTDDPQRRREEHGDPTDWQQTGPFPQQAAAHEWERQQIRLRGRQGGRDGTGWKFGYWYTITPDTRQQQGLEAR
jgi:hypothetical protein